MSRIIKAALLKKLFFTFCLLFPCSVDGDSDDYYHDRVLLDADQSMISIEMGVAGLVFDTSDWRDSVTELPEWRLIGDLKIDSIVQNDFSMVALTQESQVESVFIKSTELCDAFRKLNVWLLIKGFPKRVPADTLYWDSIRDMMHNVPDLSVYYEIRYDSLISYNSVSHCLSKVPDLEYGRSSIPVVD